MESAEESPLRIPQHLHEARAEDRVWSLLLLPEVQKAISYRVQRE